MGLAIGSGVGMWVVQTAYLSGPPETVLAGLTVIDPLTAVAIGTILLGEYSAMPGHFLGALVFFAATAIVGVLLLVRAHPAVQRMPQASATEASAPAPPSQPQQSPSSMPAHRGAGVSNRRNWS